MGSLNVLVPEDRMSLSDSKEYKMRALFKGYKRAIEKKIGSAEELPGLQSRVYPKSVDVREAQPLLDFGTAVDDWRCAPLVAVNTFYSCNQAIAAPLLTANQLLVIYGIGLEETPMPVSRLVFRNNNAAGNIVAVFDLEQLIPYDHWFGFFSEPIVVDPSRAFAAQVRCRIATGVFSRVRLATFMFEPAGTLIA